SRCLDVVGEAAGLTRQDIFVIPGNHDVQRNVDQIDKNVSRLVRALRAGEESVDTALADASDRALLEKRQANYLAFARDFAPACRASSSESALWWRYDLAGDGGLCVRLGGLNTALLAADDDQGSLRLGKAQLAHLLLDPAPGPSTVVMVLTHHPLHWLADEGEVGGWVKAHVHVHLSGHVHEAHAEQVISGASGSFLRVVAGASHGDKNSMGAPASHGYNVAAIVRGADGKLHLAVWPRRWSHKKKLFCSDIDNLPDGEVRSLHELRGVALPAPATLEQSAEMTRMPTTRKRVRDFPKLVAALQKCIHEKNAKVESPCFLRDPTLGPGGDLCEFDVVVTAPVGDSTLRIGIEVKEWRKPVDVPVVREFVQRARACGIHRPVIVASSGFTKGAIELALHHHVDLRTLKQSTADPLSLMASWRFMYRAFHIRVEKDRASAWRAAIDSFTTELGIFLFPQAGRRSPTDFVTYFLQMHARLCSERILGGEQPKEGRMRDPFMAIVNSETFLFKFRSKSTRATTYTELATIVEYDAVTDRTALRRFVYDDPTTGKSVGEVLELRTALGQPETGDLFAQPWSAQANMLLTHIPSWNAKEASVQHFQKFFDDLPMGTVHEHVWIEIPCAFQAVF
ncbi:MAG: hypothetical protein E6J91_25750, partial [Deltaproteobacteria bacterium]